MRLAITGCNGRVGPRVTKLALEQGHDVLGIDYSTLPASAECPWLDNSRYTFIQADLQDFDTVLAVLEGCEAVISLAGHPSPDDYKVKTHNRWSFLLQ